MPRLLDLFCKAGGAGMGYHLAGFEVVGVDIKKQRNYPFEFHHADALDFDLSGFDLVHASPPCQRFSQLTRMTTDPKTHQDLITPMRTLLQASGIPYIIENVPGSPLVDPLTLCGSMFSLKVRRHRLFELGGFQADQPECRHDLQGKVVGVYGKSGGSSKRDGVTLPSLDDWRDAMGIDWMSSRELAQAVPPAYTKYLGDQFLSKP